MTSLLQKIRALPITTKKTLIVLIVGCLAVFAFIVWIVTGYGLTKESEGLDAFSQSVNGVSNLIQERTTDYQNTKAELEDSLKQTLQSQALLMPEGLKDLKEEPDGILHLGYEHRENGTHTILEQVEFYPSFCIVTATISNESEQDLYFDASRGSVIIQQLPNQSEVSYQPLYQTGAPTQLKGNQSAQIGIIFGPINGRNKFEIAIGDYSPALDSTAPNTWAARFEIDPEKIITN